MQKTLLLCLLASSAAAYAQRSESCPDSHRITVRGATYTAPTAGSGEWLGIAAPGISGAIQTFESATFYPDDADAARPTGKFGKCSYRTANGPVDLRYKPQDTEPTVMLTDLNDWQAQQGPFGLRYFECRTPLASQCRFTLSQPAGR
ncbi:MULTISPECIES: DUF3757 domain-containing protein [unclassified Paludibacterium]|uniref:DUF3757 domain-containing protein n=1 Tax=unclassified Paludibacterium TaxID=2618429 RepID=UPI001C05ECAF|nr:DUF3757 domain-containing protein [Paludibacterium sp. B53371]BEV73004.1 hypothetical protein THUN1379_24860 [Paludibacterium sp. THUN1379]